MSKIKLVPHPTSNMTPACRRGLSQLLAEQQGDIEVLWVSHSSLLEELDHGGWYGCSKVKKPELPWGDPEDDVCERAMGALCQGLVGGNFLGLQELDASSANLCHHPLMLLLSALEQGTCPSLRSLDTGNNDMATWYGVGRAIADVLESDHCRQLEALLIGTQYDYMEEEEPDKVVPIAIAIEAGSCPNLRHLALHGCVHTESDVDA